MSRITSYRVIQAEGNRGLAAEVQKAINEGWEPHGSVVITVHWIPGAGPHPGKHVDRMFQPMVKREPEHAELKRLRDTERYISGIVDQLDHPITDDFGMLTFAHEEMERALRGGPFERKPANG